jgi:RNA polymerase sigma-70 factor (ECF subfamily)
MLRVGRGDGAACGELVERHLPRMVAFARRITGNQADAEDVAQEVFLRLWSKAGAWRPEAKLTTWLHQVALNLCRDRLRRAAPTPLDQAPEPVDPAPSAAAAVQRAQSARRVEAALAGLPARQRAALALCHYQGLSNLEAAEVLGVGVEALESLLARARRTLRRGLAAEAPDLLGGEP